MTTAITGLIAVFFCEEYMLDTRYIQKKGPWINVDTYINVVPLRIYTDGCFLK